MNQQTMPVSLIKAQGVQVPSLIDANKKGEKSTQAISTSTITTSNNVVVGNPISSTIQPSQSSSFPSPPKEKEPIAGLLNQTESTTKGESITKGGLLALVSVLNPSVVEEKKKKEEKKKEPPKKSSKKFSKAIIVKSIKSKGEPSCLNEFRPCLTHSPSPKKPHGKNKLVVDFPMPKSDKDKLLDLAIYMGNLARNGRMMRK